MRHGGLSLLRLAGAAALLGLLAWLRVADVAKGPFEEPPASSRGVESTVPEAQRCRVEVRFWEIKKGLYHAYILTSDRHGTTDFRAGPASPGPLVKRIWAFLTPGSPKAERWGPLRAEHGPYVPGTVDYDPGSPPTSGGSKLIIGRLLLISYLI